MPAYTAEQAALLHKQMTEVVMAKVCSVFDDVWLAVNDIEHCFFRELQQKHSCHLLDQGSGNLGVRLQALAKASFMDARDTPIMFLGTDSPHVDIDRYQQALSALAHHDVAVGPVEDGGYDLIAMANNFPVLFRDIDWGTKSVFTETLNNIHNLNLSVKVLSVSFDLDRPEDLRRSPPELWRPRR